MSTNSLPVEARATRGTHATIAGVILQLAMVGIGHVVPALRAFWGPGGTLISLVVGVWAGWNIGTTATAITSGAIAGGLGAFLGIGLVVVLGDVPATLLLFGTLTSTVAGIIGAVITLKVRRR